MTLLRRTLLPLVVAATTLLTPLVGVPGASAAESGKPTWSVTPGGEGGGNQRSAFFYTLKPGAVLRDSVVINNTGRRALKLDLYAADAYQTKGEGAFTVRQATDDKLGVSRWVAFGHRSRFKVAPGKAVSIPFEVRLPSDAQPGDHVGAVMAAAVKSEKSGGDGALGFDVRRRIGARIYLRVEGPTDPSLAVDRLTSRATPDLVPFVGGTGHVEIDYSVTNTGNVQQAPEAVMELVGPFGNTVGTKKVEVPELLPGSTVTGTVRFDRLPAQGRLRARLALESPDADAEAVTTVWALPWVPALVLAGLALLWWLRRGGWRRLRERTTRRRRTTAAAEPAEEPASAGAGSSTTASRRALPGLAAAALLALGLAQASPAVAADPAVAVQPAASRIGATVQVGGTGWPTGVLVDVAVCGGGGTSSAGCALGHARQVGTDEAGAFSLPLVLVPPPRACPCTVLVTGPGGARASADLVLAGHPLRRGAPREPRRPDVRVTDARVEGVPSVRTWFGLAGEAVLVLELHNSGTAAGRPRLDVAWRADGGAHPVTPPDVGTVEAGESTTVEVPVRLDALGLGTHVVEGTVDVDGAEEAFAATTGVYPWGLLVVTALLVGGGLFLRWRWRARRHRGQVAQDEEAADGADAGTGPSAGGGGGSALDDLFEPSR